MSHGEDGNGSYKQRERAAALHRGMGRRRRGSYEQRERAAAPHRDMGRRRSAMAHAAPHRDMGRRRRAIAHRTSRCSSISVSGTPESFACLKTASNRSDVLEATKQSSREPTMLQPWGGICPQMRVFQRARSAKGALLVRMLHLTALSAVLVPLAVRQVLRAKSARCVQPENSTQRTVGDTSTVRTALSARSARQANSATLLGSRSLRGTVCLGMS